MGLLKSFLIVCLILCQISGFAQQDPLITQFWNISTSYNPANSGLSYKHQAGINYRNQWYGLDGAPNTLLATYNTRLDKYKSGIGFNYKYETISVFNQSRFDLNYSYHLDLGKEQKLAFGLSAEVSQLSIDKNSSYLPSKSGFGFLANLESLIKQKNSLSV